MKYLSLTFGILCFISFFYSFFENVETKEFLSFEVNIWVYRFIYLFFSIIMISYCFKKRKNS